MAIDKDAGSEGLASFCAKIKEFSKLLSNILTNLKLLGSNSSRAFKNLKVFRKKTFKKSFNKISADVKTYNLVQLKETTVIINDILEAELAAQKKDDTP